MEQQQSIEKSFEDEINALERQLLQMEQATCPLKHTFSKGLYAREIFMPAGTFIISETHVTQHQFVISQGAVSIWDNDGEEILIQAPYSGVTEPGTRRVLFIHSDCIFTTFHPTTIKPKTNDPKDVSLAVEKIGRKILKHNPNWDITGKGMGNMELQLNKKGGSKCRGLEQL